MQDDILTHICLRKSGMGLAKHATYALNKGYFNDLRPNLDGIESAVDNVKNLITYGIKVGKYCATHGLRGSSDDYLEFIEDCGYFVAELNAKIRSAEDIEEFKADSAIYITALTKIAEFMSLPTNPGSVSIEDISTCEGVNFSTIKEDSNKIFHLINANIYSNKPHEIVSSQLNSVVLSLEGKESTRTMNFWMSIEREFNSVMYPLIDKGIIEVEKYDEFINEANETDFDADAAIEYLIPFDRRVLRLWAREEYNENPVGDWASFKEEYIANAQAKYDAAVAEIRPHVVKYLSDLKKYKEKVEAEMYGGAYKTISEIWDRFYD